jgi:hypothetical protein
MDASPGGNIVTATLNGASGNDQFLITSAADPTLANLNLQGGAGNDIFGASSTGPVGSAPAGGEIVPVSGAQIVISGESSTSKTGPNQLVQYGGSDRYQQRPGDFAGKRPGA